MTPEEEEEFIREQQEIARAFLEKFDPLRPASPRQKLGWTIALELRRNNRLPEEEP